MAACDIRVELRGCIYEDQMRAYFNFEWVVYSFLLVFETGQALIWWSRSSAGSGFSKPLIIHLMGVGLALVRLIYIITLCYLEVSVYITEVLWCVYWNFAGGFVLTAAEIWVELAFAPEKSSRIRAHMLLSVKTFRRIHVLLQALNPLVDMPLLLYALKLREEGRGHESSIIVRTLFLSIMPAIVAVAGLCISISGWRLHKEMKEMLLFESQQTMPRDLYQQSLTRARMVLGVSLALSYLCINTATITVLFGALYPVLRHSRTAAAPFTLCHIGIVPFVFVAVRLVMPPPNHFTIHNNRTIGFRARISAAFHLLPDVIPKIAGLEPPVRSEKRSNSRLSVLWRASSHSHATSQSPQSAPSHTIENSVAV